MPAPSLLAIASTCRRRSPGRLRTPPMKRPSLAIRPSPRPRFRWQPVPPTPFGRWRMRYAALAGDTDGTDGGTGQPEDPAGAFVNDNTMARAQALGLDPDAFLADNNSTEFFASLGDLLKPGPTYTNVNDFRAILIDGPIVDSPIVDST